MRKAQVTANAMNAILVRKNAKPEEYSKAVADAKRAWTEHGKRPAWGCKWYDESFLHFFCGSVTVIKRLGVES